VEEGRSRRERRRRRVVVKRKGVRKERVNWRGVGLEVGWLAVLLSLLVEGGVLPLQSWS
jgi:hypothetical protein